MGDTPSLFKWLTLPAREPETPQEYFARLPQLETERLLLRRLTLRDASDIYRYAKDPEVARHVLWSAHTSIWESRAYLRYILYQYRSGEPSSWGIVDKSSGHVIGTIGFMSWQADNALAEVGYSLSRAYWGQGLMTEALAPVLQEGFMKLQLNRIEAMHFTDNPASGRVMEKCGMQHEGRLRGRIFNKGEYRDVEMWGILRKDWEKLNR